MSAARQMFLRHTGNLLLGGAVFVVCAMGCRRYEPAYDMIVVRATETPAGRAGQVAWDESDPFGELIANPDRELWMPRLPLLWQLGKASAVSRNFEPVYFEPGSDRLRFDSQRALRESAAWLVENPDVWVTLVGHCDPEGSAEYSYSLGLVRARHGRDRLISFGVGEDRLFILTYGEERPVTPSTDFRASQLNSRLEFVAYYPPVDGFLATVAGALPVPPPVRDPEPGPRGVDVP